MTYKVLRCRLTAKRTEDALNKLEQEGYYVVTSSNNGNCVILYRKDKEMKK